MSKINSVNHDEIIVNEDRFVLYLSEKDIMERIKELARQISADYKDKTPVFIGVLNGAFIFMADLIKNVSVTCEIDFLKLSSYGDAKISAGDVRVLKELNCDINGKDVIIIEDIVDTGLSIHYINKILEGFFPASVKVATLLLKPESLKYNVKIDYIGFEIPSKFVIGYGLDYAQKYRNLRSLYILSVNGVL
jgi:hypoxanthine phosphoribosyltransferase